MGGLAVVFFIGIYIAIAYWVFKRFDGSNFRWLVVALAVLIPSGDAIVGRLYLKHLCAEEGGLKVSRVVEHVDGFMDYAFSGGDYWVKERGYQFTEDRPVNEMTTRYSKQNGQISRENNVLPQSQYRVRSEYVGSLRDPYLRHVFLVETIPNRETLATDTQIAFNGGWAERFIALFSDAGGGTVAWCTNTEKQPDVRYEKIISTVLKQ